MAWNESKKYDTGQNPSVSMNSQKIVVETHFAAGSLTNPGETLWYHVGKLTSDATVDWGKSHKYDSGSDPSVAVNDSGQVVEVHLTSNINQRDLWYHVGKVKGDVIEWGPSHKYDTGGDPSVAINNHGTVVVHDSGIGLGSSDLWYRVGQIAGDKIDWKGKAKFSGGIDPDVAIDDDGNVVNVHTGSVPFELWYNVGVVKGTTIDWDKGRRLSDGQAPSVAIGKDKTVLAAYGAPNPNTRDAFLLYRTGVISGEGINWDTNGENFDKGLLINLTLLNNGEAVQVHQSENKETLWYSVGHFVRK
jgi:hypothetical protein